MNQINIQKSISSLWACYYHNQLSVFHVIVTFSKVTPPAMEDPGKALLGILNSSDTATGNNQNKAQMGVASLSLISGEDDVGVSAEDKQQVNTESTHH